MADSSTAVGLHRPRLPLHLWLPQRDCTGGLPGFATAVWPSDLFLSNGGKGIAPDFPRVKKTFNDEWTYQDTGVRGDRAWRDMLPEGYGVVELRWPERLKLPKKTYYVDHPSSEKEGIELAEVSVVKELDCLIKVRSAFIGYEYNMRLSQHMKTEVHACLDFGE